MGQRSQGAIDKLELAVQVSSQDPDVGSRGQAQPGARAVPPRLEADAREPGSQDAAGDFERATRDPRVLKGTEPMAFEFSYGARAARQRRAAPRRHGCSAASRRRAARSSYLKGAYARVGVAVLLGVRQLPERQRPRARSRPAADLAKLEGDLGGKVREVVASCWEMVAVDEWRSGNPGSAQRAHHERGEDRDRGPEAAVDHGPRRALARPRTSSTSSRGSPGTHPSRSSISGSSTTCSASPRKPTTRGSGPRPTA